MTEPTNVSLQKMIYTRACDGINKDTSNTNQAMRRRKNKYELKMHKRKKNAKKKILAIFS
jgi:hypothetical protein